jgi:hypothetical protein
VHFSYNKHQLCTENRSFSTSFLCVAPISAAFLEQILVFGCTLCVRKAVVLLEQQGFCYKSPLCGTLLLPRLIARLEKWAEAPFARAGFCWLSLREGRAQVLYLCEQPHRVNVSVPPPLLQVRRHRRHKRHSRGRSSSSSSSSGAQTLKSHKLVPRQEIFQSFQVTRRMAPATGNPRPGVADICLHPGRGEICNDVRVLRLP